MRTFSISQKTSAIFTSAFLSPTALHFRPNLSIQPQICTPFSHCIRQPRRHHLFAMRTTSSQPLPTASAVSSVVGNNPVFAQCMLRITDPTASKQFYQTLGMKFLTRFDFPDYKFSLFFYAYLPTNIPAPPPVSAPQPERAKWLWSIPYPTMELTWNWTKDTFEDSVKDAQDGNKGDEVYVSGNEDPKGYAGIQIRVNDVHAALNCLQKNGITVVDNPTKCNDTGLITAAVTDPDGYRVQLITSSSSSSDMTVIPDSLQPFDPVLSSVMLRIKDPRSALTFCNRIGMRYLTRIEYPSLSQTHYMLGYSGAEDVPADSADNDTRLEWVSKRRECLLQLIHEWGTEESDDTIYQNGNVKPFRGFGHVGIIIDDIYKGMGDLEKEGYKVVRKPTPFADVGDIAFIAEPSTDYWVEIITREGNASDMPYEQPVIGVDA